LFFQDTLKDTEGHSEVLKLLLSICEILEDSDKIRRVKIIETAWHGVWLRALEWECLLEQKGGKEAKELKILQSDSSNINEDILKLTTAPEYSSMLMYGVAHSVTIVKSPHCQLEISSSTECDIMTSSKMKHLDSSDCEGVSSDSGFSDLSGYLPTLLAENAHKECNFTGQKRLKDDSGNKQKHKKRKNKVIGVGTEYSQTQMYLKTVLCLLILMIFSLFTSLLLYNISCNNNTCAINITTHINYYNHHHPI
jgi:hypothetical protein